MIQPKGTPPELEQPPASPAPEEEAAVDSADDGREAGDGGGSEGAEGRGIGGAAGGASSGSGIGVEDAPAYPGAGWKRPEQAQRDCVQNSVRIPSGLRGFVSGPITVKFAIGADGAPSAFQLIGSVPDARIAGAIWQAIQSCRWIAGADAEGRPARLWVIMPIRFQAG
jgi:protein TonB